MTAAALVFAAVFGLAARDVAVVSDLGLTVVARAPAAVFGLAAAVAEHAVAVASGLALIFFEPVLASALVFFVVAFPADRAFALPGVLAAHRPLC